MQLCTDLESYYGSVVYSTLRIQGVSLQPQEVVSDICLAGETPWRLYSVCSSQVVDGVRIHGIAEYRVRWYSRSF